MTAGERIGIVGPNGAGKTTLLRAILAAADASHRGRQLATPSALIAGEILVGKNTRIAYLDQARAGLDDQKSIFDDVRGNHGSMVVNLGVPGRTSMDLRSYLELFLFDASKQRQKVGALSGGERARVALAKVLRDGANLLVFDEPTNDLDLPTLAALEELLDGYEGSVLVVTHDRAFLDRVATGILAFEWGTGWPPGGGPRGLATVTRYAGGYQDYLAQRGERPAVALAASREQSSAASAAPRLAEAKSRKPKGGLTFGERLELDRIIQAIEHAETELLRLEGLLADPALYSTRGHDVGALHAQVNDARSLLARLVAQWEALEKKNVD
jgi:ATP-binding cassette subfamily F protein uup